MGAMSFVIRMAGLKGSCYPRHAHTFIYRQCPQEPCTSPRPHLASLLTLGPTCGITEAGVSKPQNRQGSRLMHDPH